MRFNGPFVAIALSVMAAPAVSAPPGSPCVADGTSVTVTGTVRLLHNRDRATGKPYTFTALASDRPYCISDDDADDRSRTPTKLLWLAAPDAGPDHLDAVARRYIGRRVIVRAKIVATNGGGPSLFYDSIAPQ